MSPLAYPVERVTLTENTWRIVQHNRLARLRRLEDRARTGDPRALDTFRRLAQLFLADAALLRAQHPEWLQ